jgi:transposase InsO family protein
MLRPTSRLPPTSTHPPCSIANAYNNTSTIVRRPEPSSRTSPRPLPAEQYRFPWNALSATASQPLPLPQQPSPRPSPSVSSPRPATPPELSTEEDDDDFVRGHVTEYVDADVDPSDDIGGDVDADICADDLSFMDWVHRDIQSHQKIHHLSDDRYDLLMTCVQNVNFLRDNRHNTDSVAYAWAYSQLQRHTYTIQYVREHDTNKTYAVLAESVVDKKTNQPRFLMPVKLSEVEYRLQQLHAEIGHKGDNSMWATIRERFSFIPRSWMRAFIRRCDICEKRRGKQNAKPRVAIIHNRIFETHAIDFIDYSHSPDGEFKYVLHLVDNVSKMHFVECTRTKEAAEVARFLSLVWSITGTPLKLQSDNGGEFTAQIIQDLCREMNVQICRSPAYDPAANGCVERANQTLERLIAKYNDVHGTTGFVAAAYKCCMIHNHTYHRTINASPYENVFSFKPRNRSYTSALSLTDFEPYSAESARIKSHTRRPFTPVVNDGEQPAQTTSVTEETEDNAAVALTELADEWDDPPVFDLSPTSRACAEDSKPLTPTQPNSQSPTQQLQLTAEVNGVASSVSINPMTISSQPSAATSPRQSFPSPTQPSLSQPILSQTAPNIEPSFQSNAVSQIPSSAQSSDVSSTPSSTESDAAASLSATCINEILCEDLQMLPPGMVGPIGKQLADELNVNGCVFVLVGTYAKGLCTISAVLNAASKQLVSEQQTNDFRRDLADRVEREWSDNDYKQVTCFDGKQSCDTRQQFIAALRQLDAHLGTEVFRILSVFLQLNIYIVTNIITRTTQVSGSEHVDVVTTCELAIQQEDVDESIAVYHKFMRHVDKSNLTAKTPAEDSGGHFETLAHRDATSHLTYRWASDQQPMITLQKFLQRDNLHREYINRQGLLQKSLAKRNNAVTFAIGDAVGVLLDQQFRRKLKSINHNAIMNIPAVVAFTRTSNNGIQQYWVMIRTGAIINEMMTVDNLRKITGDKSQFKSYPISTWMNAQRVTIAQAYSVYYPAPGPSYATVLQNETSVPDKTATTNITSLIKNNKSTKQRQSTTSKTPLRRRGAPHKTRTIPPLSASTKSSVPAKSSATATATSSGPSKKRSAAVDTISLSPVARKKARATNVSPLPIPTDAIRFVNRSGKAEIVRIVKASKPDSKTRRFHLQWYNEYGGEVADKWEQEGASFWTIQPEYGELLRRFLVAQAGPIIIDDSDE